MGVLELAAAIVGLFKAIVDLQAAEFAALPAEEKTKVAQQHAAERQAFLDLFGQLIPKAG